MSENKTKVVKKTAKKAPANTAQKSSEIEKWFKLYLKSRHGSKEDRKKARSELMVLEESLVKQL